MNSAGNSGLVMEAFVLSGAMAPCFFKRVNVLKAKKLSGTESFLLLNVPRTRFELASLAAPPPQDGMSTNFTTWVCKGLQN